MMEQALKLAKAAAGKGEVPVGAVIVNPLTQEIIAATHNLTETDNNPTAHAEILAIRIACRKIGNPRLEGFDMYVTLEPCAMCAAAISLARVKRLYFGAYDTKMGGVENGVRFFNSTACHHKPEVFGGIMDRESRELLQEFFRKIRSS
jgi:tRNA(adenine34) deaminase